MVYEEIVNLTSNHRQLVTHKAAGLELDIVFDAVFAVAVDVDVDFFVHALILAQCFFFVNTIVR